MTSPSTPPKRSRSGSAVDERPSKLQKTSSEPVPKPTGLEESGILEEISEKVLVSNKTEEDEESYLQRQKLSSHPYLVRKKCIKASRVSRKWKHMPVEAQQGMDNFTGYVCYRNSLMQALLHSPKFCNWLRKYHSRDQCTHHDDQEDAPPCIACNLYDVMEAYWARDEDKLLKTSKALHVSFRKNGWNPGSSSGQADPDEQFTWLVATLREQLPSQVFSIFLALTQPILYSSTKCAACGHASSNPGEAEGSLSIELQPRIRHGTLGAYVHKYLTYVVEDYKCDSCASTKPKTRERLIAFSPDTLLVQLKRFDPMGNKDKHPVVLSPILNLDPYRTECNKKNSRYELSAIVSHSGSLSFGHYRCTAKGPDGKWAIYNDAIMTRCSEEEALNPGVKTAWTPYLLFFQRIRAPKP